MKDNVNLTLSSGNYVKLVPYRPEHVAQYHEWMVCEPRAAAPRLCCVLRFDCIQVHATSLSTIVSLRCCRRMLS